jgi:predicted DNA-binding protein YlxM (UPF0122 family)
MTENRGEFRKSGMEKERIEQAYMLLLADKLKILQLCHLDEESADEVFGRMTIKINTPDAVNLDDFLVNKQYRLQLYKYTLVDLLRHRNSKIKVAGPILGDMDYPSNTSEERFLGGVDEYDFLHDHLAEIWEDIVDRAESKNIDEQYLKNINIIIHRKFDGYSNKEIANELKLDESRISQIIVRLRDLFPEYNYFWELVTNKKRGDATDIDETLSLKISRERLQNVIYDLENTSELTNLEKAALVLAKWYQNPTQTLEERDLAITVLGIKPTPKNLVLLRSILEKKANFLSINWGNLLKENQKLKP